VILAKVKISNFRNLKDVTIDLTNVAHETIYDSKRL